MFWSNDCTTNKGPVRIQYRYLVPIYVFPEMKLIFPNQNYNVLSPSSYTHISVRDLYISRIGLPILLHGNIDRSWEYINHSQIHECGIWDWGRAIPNKGIHKWDFSFKCGLSQTDHLSGNYSFKKNYLKADNSHPCHNFRKNSKLVSFN